MKAIAITPGSQGVQLIDCPEPAIQAPDGVKAQVIRVGICGTDREEVAGGRSMVPAGQSRMVIGHEMFSQVVEVGPAVTRVKPGDFAVFTVRRGCGLCLPCLMNRSDMCETGQYLERGIWGLNGYQTELVVDKEQYVVRVPPELESTGVLTEPFSIVEKAIAESVRIQFSRLPDALATPEWLFGRRCLVAGLGPVGLLACLALRLRGAQVFGLDIVDEGSARPQWLERIGGRYVDGRKVPVDQVEDQLGMMDMLLEAAGVPNLAFNLLDCLGMDGIYVLTGIPGGSQTLQIPGAELMRQMVLDNQVMFGSVNASRDHFQMAVTDLNQARFTWGNIAEQLISDRFPYTDFQNALTRHTEDEIKVVLEWSQPEKK